MTQLGFTADANLQLKDAGLVAASAAAQVGGSNKIIDVGLGRIDAVAVIDASAIEVDTGNELYTILVQGSTDPAFASGVVGLGSIRLGHSSTTLDTASSPTGRYELHFTNERGGTIYRYIRAYTVVAGTIATGVNYQARLVPQMDGGA